MFETADAPAQAVELESKFVKLPDGVKVHYQESGPATAPAVLLTHGFLGSVRDWRYTTGPLAEYTAGQGQPLRTIALDWVGFGRTSKPLVNYSLFYFADFLQKFADALGLKQFDLIGHSMGGKHNLAFAILYPQYVRKLGLVDTDGFVKDPAWTSYTNRFWFKPLANLSTDLLGQERFLKLSLKNIFHDPRFYPSTEEMARMVQELRDEEYRTALRALNRDYPRLSLHLTGLRVRLPEIKAPVQIFWGRQDRILALAQGYTAQAEIPGAKLHIFEDCGHLPQVEKAREFIELTSQFLLS